MSFKGWLRKARQRHRVSIGKSEWLKLKNSPCYYCGVEPHLLLNFYHRLNLNKTAWMTIDRKNNSLGYEPNNVVPCCFNCNRIKGSFFSAEEMKFIADNLIKPKLKDYTPEVWEEWLESEEDYEEISSGER